MSKETPDLATRFLAPEGWTWGTFNNPDTGHNIRYGHATPTAPKAIVVALGGLSEFSEKYFEVAHDMLARGYAFWTLDWQYQGLSDRLQSNPQKRHSDGYDADLSDLYKLIQDQVKPNLPMIMLGHSMGGNLGLRFLSNHPDIFDAAALTAPMIDIKDLKLYGPFLGAMLASLSFFHLEYIPGGRNWHENMRSSDGSDIFSSDPVRDAVHNAWCLANPGLQVGNPTFQWLNESVKSCNILKKSDILEKIKIPVLLTLAEREKLVDNDAIRRAAQKLPHATLLELEDSRHEILMERDEIRNQFLKSFDDLVKNNKIIST